jgi:hypothetical protein
MPKNSNSSHCCLLPVACCLTSARSLWIESEFFREKESLYHTNLFLVGNFTEWQQVFSSLTVSIITDIISQ